MYLDSQKTIYGIFYYAVPKQCCASSRGGVFECPFLSTLFSCLKYREDYYNFIHLFIGYFHNFFSFSVTGPYLRAIVIDELGAAEDSVINFVPMADFGGNCTSYVFHLFLFNFFMPSNAFENHAIESLY